MRPLKMYRVTHPALVCLAFVHGMPLLSTSWLCAAESTPTAEAAPRGSSPAAIAHFRAAVALQNRGVYDLAADEWRRFHDLFPQDPLAAKAQHYLGICHLQLQQYGKARETLAAVIAQNPRFELLESATMNLALAQFNEGQAGDGTALDQAVGTFAALLEQYPKSQYAAEARFYQAEALYARGKKTDAIGAFQKFLTDHPEHALEAKVLYGLGVAQQENGDHAGAGATFDRFLGKFAQDALATEVSLRRADTLRAGGSLAEAEQRFAAVAAMPDATLADYALLRQAQCRDDQNDYDAAARLYGRLVETYPQSAHVEAARLAAGRCACLAGQLAEARQYLDGYVSSGGPAAGEASHWLARVWLQEGKPEEALRVVEAALAKAEDAAITTSLQIDRADALHDLPERRQESIGLYAAVARAAPEHSLGPQAAYMAAYTAMELGRYADAVQFARSFLQAYVDHKLTPDVTVIEAESLCQLQEYDAAAACYRRLLAGGTQHADAEMWQVRAGLCLHQAKKPTEVLRHFEPLLGHLKSPAAQASAQWLIGASHYGLKQLEPAITALQAALAAEPKGRHADAVLLLLAQAQRDAGQTQDAVATLDRLCQELPECEAIDQAYYLRGEMKAATGDPAGAVTDLKKVCATWPKSPLVPHALFRLGWTQLAQQEPEAAAATMTRLLAEYGQHALVGQARLARATAWQQAGEFAAAVEDVAAVLQSQPTGSERSDALYVRGLCEAGLKRPAAAIATLETILNEDPSYAAADRVLYELAWNYRESKQPQRAVETFARLAGAHPESPLAAECLFRVGEAEYEARRYTEAADLYRQAMHKTDDQPLREKASHKLGWARFQQGAFDQAANVFRDQVEQFPSGVLATDGLVMLGESLFQQQQYGPAREAFALARGRKEPVSSGPLQALALLHAAQSATQLEQWDEGLALLQQCADKYPDSQHQDEVLYEQAWVKQNQGKLDEAKRHYEQVADRNQTLLGARAHFMIGEIEFQQKAYAEAVRSFFRVAYGYGAVEAPEPFHVWQADSLFEAARCLEQLGKTEPARRLYRELVEHYPRSNKVADARRKLESL